MVAYIIIPSYEPMWISNGICDYTSWCTCGGTGCGIAVSGNDPRFFEITFRSEREDRLRRALESFKVVAFRTEPTASRASSLLASAMETSAKGLISDIELMEVVCSVRDFIYAGVKTKPYKGRPARWPHED